ncbi:GL13158 [Drosophila persimilis]|uniref:GL13158 n=1 Tax=Drosophila persimilis TaxID=7234 RepID=B4HDC9_DROPE|nr:GL13158 [Drosophila persimilis]
MVPLVPAWFHLFQFQYTFHSLVRKTNQKALVCIGKLFHQFVEQNGTDCGPRPDFGTFPMVFPRENAALNTRTIPFHTFQALKSTQVFHVESSKIGTIEMAFREQPAGTHTHPHWRIGGF